MSKGTKQPKKQVTEIVGPDVDSHDDAERVIGRRVTYRGDEHKYLVGSELVIVALLKGALRESDPDVLTDEESVHAAGGVTADDRIEVAPFIKEENRFSFVTSDPRARLCPGDRGTAQAARNSVPIWTRFAI